MDIIFLVNLALVGICVIFCVYKGFKSKIFKSLSFAYICVFATCIGSKYSKLLLPNFNVIDIENNLLEKSLTEKINSTIVTLVGTIILIISLNIMLKQIFKIVDGRLEKSLYMEIMDRIRGAVDGLFVLYKIGNISLDSNIEITSELNIQTVPDNSVLRKNTDMYKWIGNLN